MSGNALPAELTRGAHGAELAVLAHLTGWAMPAPGGPFGRDLRAMPARLRDCALSQAVDAAAAARTAAISAKVSPGALAVHVTEAMRRAVTDGTWLCEPAEPQYLADPYRWTLIWGTRQHTAIEQAVGTRASAEDWDQQLADALGAFRDLRWPRTYLRSTPPAAAKPASS